MAQEKDFGWRGGLFELCGFEGEDFSRGAIFSRGFEASSVAETGRMERESENRLARYGGVRREREKSNLELAGERIWRGTENGHVMVGIDSDDASFEKAGRAIGAAEENVRLAPVAEGFEDVGDGEKVALVVDEEGVAKEGVVITAGGGGLVEAVDEGTDGGGGG